MLTEQIKCVVCGEYESVQIGTEQAAASLCYRCEEEEDE